MYVQISLSNARSRRSAYWHLPWRPSWYLKLNMSKMELMTTFALFQIPPNLPYLQLSLSQVRTMPSSQPRMSERVGHLWLFSFPHTPHPPPSGNPVHSTFKPYSELNSFLTSAASLPVSSTILSHPDHWSVLALVQSVLNRTSWVKPFKMYMRSHHFYAQNTTPDWLPYTPPLATAFHLN